MTGAIEGDDVNAPTFVQLPDEDECKESDFHFVLGLVTLCKNSIKDIIIGSYPFPLVV